MNINYTFITLNVLFSVSYVRLKFILNALFYMPLGQVLMEGKSVCVF